jgi:WD40 repeat protein
VPEPEQPSESDQATLAALSTSPLASSDDTIAAPSAAARVTDVTDATLAGEALASDATIASQVVPLPSRGPASRDATLDSAFRALGRPAPRPEGAIQGRYAPDALLGRGGMGEVWLAADQRLARAVALKRMRVESPSDEALARFLREAQLTGSLEHPNIVPIYDLGVDEQGQLFFTMRRLRGRSLAERITAGEAGTQLERLDVFRKICDAVAFAHAQGVIHRDLKPDNVMIGEFGEVVVLDWGLAKRVGETLELAGTSVPADASGASTDSNLTVGGALMGTPAYMAPEQALGQLERLDPRTDVYALGVILYELLTDSRPFAGSLPALLAAVIEGRFDPPRSKRALARELDAIVCKAMAREQADRYASVEALRADLQAFLEGRPISLVRYRATQRLAKWAGRNRVLVGATAITGAVGLAGLLAAGWVYLRDVSAARDRAEQARDEATHARDEATHARDEATRARDEARAAERLAIRRAADSAVALATAFAQMGELPRASDELATARSLYAEAGASARRAAITQAYVDGLNPPPIYARPLPSDALLLAIDAGGRRFAWVEGTRLTIEDWARGERLLEREIGEREGMQARFVGDTLRLLRRGDDRIELVELRAEGERVLGSVASGTRVQLCDDGRHVIVERPDQLVERWDAEQSLVVGAGLRAGSPRAASHDGHRVLFDPDRAAYLSIPRALELWDFEQGERLATLPGASRVDLAPDGEAIVLGREQEGVRMFDARGRLVWQDDAHIISGGGQFSPDGTRVLSHRQTGGVHWWTSAGRHGGGRETRGDLVGTDAAGGLFFVHDRSRGVLELWTDGGGANEALPLPIEQPLGFDTGAAGSLALASGRPAWLGLYDPWTGALLEPLVNPDVVVDLDLELEREGLALAASPTTLRRYDLREGPQPRSELAVELGLAKATQKPGVITALRALPDRAQAFVGTSSGELLRWDLETDAIVERLDNHQYVWQLAVSPDGTKLAVAGREEKLPQLSIWSLETGTRLRDSSTIGPGYSLAWGPHDAVAVGPHRGPLGLWQADRTTPVVELPEVDAPIMALAFAHAGDLLATVSYDAQLVFWDTSEWSVLQTLPHPLTRPRFEPGDAALVGLGGRFQLDLERTSSPLAPARGLDESEADRLLALLDRLLAQHDWDGAARALEWGHDLALALPHLRSARVLWKLGRTREALAQLQTAAAAGDASVELQVWTRIVSTTVD